MPLLVEVNLTDKGGSIIQKKEGADKAAEAHNQLLEIFLNHSEYSAEEIKSSRGYFMLLASRPETKLLHALLEWVATKSPGYLSGGGGLSQPLELAASRQ